MKCLGHRAGHLEQRLSLAENGNGAHQVTFLHGEEGESASLLQFHLITFVCVTQYQDLRKPHQKGETETGGSRSGEMEPNKEPVAQESAGVKEAPVKGNPDGPTSCFSDSLNNVAKSNVMVMTRLLHMKSVAQLHSDVNHKACAGGAGQERSPECLPHSSTGTGGKGPGGPKPRQEGCPQGLNPT